MPNASMIERRRKHRMVTQGRVKHVVYEGDGLYYRTQCRLILKCSGHVVAIPGEMRGVCEKCMAAVKRMGLVRDMG